MKQYPSISHLVRSDLHIYAFDKLDGSNIRAEWDRKKGFWKYGTRKQLLDASHPVLGTASRLIRNKYESDLSKIFVKQKWAKVICFFEFWGPNSFAGNHEDEVHDITLIDVNPHKKGILRPQDFIKLFNGVDIPELLYIGKANQEFVRMVRFGKLDGMTFEGVVCKGTKKKQLIMFKVKNLAWVEKVRAKYAGQLDVLAELLDPEDFTRDQYRQRRFCPGCFRAGRLSPTCSCGTNTLDLDYYAQAPKVSASKTRWKRFFKQWFPEVDFEKCWGEKGKR